MVKRRSAGNPLVAIAYLRVSTDEQRNGPLAQRADIERYARQHGIEIVEFYSDEDVSGSDALRDRPELMKAYEAVSRHRAGLLIVQKWDRLARDTYLAETLRRTAVNLGARIVSGDGFGNGSGPNDVLLRTLLDAFASHERDMIRARTKAALAVKRERGERTGKIPYGSQLAADGVHLEPNLAEQATIATARELRGSGLTLEGVIEELEMRSMMNRNGNPFGLAAIHKLLK